MSSVVYAMFPDGEAAQRAERALSDVLPKQLLYAPLSFRRAPLEGNELPEPATEFGRNLMFSIGLGAGVMGVAGAISGAMDWILGMNVLLGLALGTVTGALMGLVGAMQAGTRRAKAELRELEPRLSAGAVLVMVEVDRGDVQTAVDCLEELHPDLVDVLGEL